MKAAIRIVQECRALSGMASGNYIVFRIETLRAAWY